MTDNDPLYLERAVDLADRIMVAFDTTSGLPLPMVNLAQRVGVPDKDLPLLVSTAEISTLQLELRYLSFLTDDDVYWEKAENVRTFHFYHFSVLILNQVMKLIKQARMPHGLASIFMQYAYHLHNFLRLTVT